MARRRLPIWLALALTAGAVAWALTGLPGRPAACLPAGCDCEAAGPGPIRQPANAWSTLALTAAGLFIVIASPGRRPGEARGRRSRRAEGADHGQAFAGGDAPAGRRARLGLPRGGGGGARAAGPSGEGRYQETRPGEPRAQAITRHVAAGALAAAGLGAFLYHAGLTAWAARLDGTTVAVLAGALGLHAVTRLAPPPGSRRLPRSHWRSLAPWLLLALGAACWWLGRSEGPWCRPESLLQAHAAWHFLAAAAVGSWLASGRSGPQPPTPSSLRAERQPDL